MSISGSWLWCLLIILSWIVLIGCKEREKEKDTGRLKNPNEISRSFDRSVTNDPQLFVQLATSTDQKDRDKLSAFLSRLSQAELEDLIKSNLSENGGNKVLLGRALTALYSVSPELALSYFEQVSSFHGGSMLLFAESAAELNPEALMGWMKTSDAFASNWRVMEVACRGLLAKNGDLALEFFAAQSSEQQEKMSRAFGMYFQGDRGKIIDFVERLDDSKGKAAMVLSLARRYGEDDPLRMYGLLTSIDDGYGTAKDRALASAVLAKGLLRVDDDGNLLVAQAYEMLGELPTRDCLSVMSDRKVLKLMLDVSIDETVKLLTGLPVSGSSHEILEEVVAVVSAKDAEKALDVALEIGTGPSRGDLVRLAIDRLAQGDPLRAVAALSGLPEDVRQSGLRGVAEGWALKGEGSARSVIEWSQGLAKEDQGLIVGAVLERTGAYHPDTALILANELMGQQSPPQIVEAVVGFIPTFVPQMVERNLSDARDWVESLSGDYKSVATAGLIESWVNIDPVAASDWLSTQSVGVARDAGAAVLANALQDVDPESANAWRSSIQKP